MSERYLRTQFTFDAEGATTEQIQDYLDRTLDALEDLGVYDADMTASIARRQVSFTLRTEQEDFGAAVAEVYSTLRTAFHAAEIGTPNWPNIHPVAHGVHEADFDGVFA